MNIIDKKEFIARLKDFESIIKNQIADHEAPPTNPKQIEELIKKVEEMDNRIKSLKPADDKIYINEEFKDLIAMKSDLVLDEIKPAPSPEILNKVFKTKAVASKPVKTIGNVTFWDGRVIKPDRDYTLKQWITPPEAAKIPYGNRQEFNNVFKTTEPEEKQVCLGTGLGKSTLFLRCLAFRGLSNEEFAALPEEERKKLGVTLVVPHESLVGSVLDGHDDWLSDEQAALQEIEALKKRNASPEEIADVERVIICPICTKKHTGYETVHNGPSSMINVFTWWEFLDAYVNSKEKPWIKQWTVFDEAHLEVPPYYALLTGLRGDKTGQYNFSPFHKEIKPFGITEMSATFSDLPTSKKLSGTTTDYYLTDFSLVDIKKHPNMFKRKMIVFCDDTKKIDLKLLKEQTKVLVLNEALKPYATDIVKSIEPPLFVIASNDFSVGFSFGDVDALSTGEIILTVISEEDKKLVEKPKPIPANLADLLQQRGRIARVAFMIAVWLTLVNKAERYPLNILRSDWVAKKLIEEFSKKDKNGKPSPELIDKSLVEKIVKHYSQKKPVPKISKKEGNRYLNLILIKDLKSKMSSKIWIVIQEEKDKVENQKNLLLKKAEAAKKKGDEETAERLTNMASKLRARNPGEYIFRNALLEHFEEKQLPSVIIEATKERIARYNTKDLEDDYVFTIKNHAVIVGWLLQCRSKYKITTKKNKEDKIEELRIQFEEYNKHGKISRMNFN